MPDKPWRCRDGSCQNPPVISGHHKFYTCHAGMPDNEIQRSPERGTPTEGARDSGAVIP